MSAEDGHGLPWQKGATGASNRRYNPSAWESSFGLGCVFISVLVFVSNKV